MDFEDIGLHDSSSHSSNAGGTLASALHTKVNDAGLLRPKTLNRVPSTGRDYISSASANRIRASSVPHLHSQGNNGSSNNSNSSGDVDEKNVNSNGNGNITIGGIVLNRKTYFNPPNTSSISHLSRAKSPKIPNYQNNGSTKNHQTSTSTNTNTDRSRARGGSIATTRSSKDDYANDEDEVTNIPDAMFFNIPLTPSQTSKTIDHQGKELTKARIERRNASYNEAMSQLDYESQGLTKALEEHTLMSNYNYSEEFYQKRQHAIDAGNGVSPRNNNNNNKADFDTNGSSVSLPDLANVQGLPPMPDYHTDPNPVPASKTKLKMMSKTRPAWLPPKARKEEKRHMQEYYGMVQAAREADQRKRDNAIRDKDRRESIASDATYLWEANIIPNWREVSRDPSLRELVWKAQIPPRCLGRVWLKCFDNSLSIGDDTFQQALKRAEEAKAKKLKRDSLVRGLDERSSFDKDEEQEEEEEEEDDDANDPFGQIAIQKVEAINATVSTTYPTLQLFQEHGPMHQDLVDVVLAYTFYRSDTAFIPGICNITALLLLNLPKIQAFIAVCNLMNRPVILAITIRDSTLLQRFYASFSEDFHKTLPSLYRHFQHTLALAPEYYVEPLVQTLFTLHAPIDIASRLLDIYAFEGDTFLSKAVLRIMGYFEPKLYTDIEDVLAILGWDAQPWQIENETNFMENIIYG